MVGCCDYSLSCATENRFVETHGIRSLRAKDEPLKAPLCPHSEEAIRHWMVCLPSTDSILDNQNDPMLRIIGVDSHADCSNITEAWMDRWILRSRRVEESAVLDTTDARLKQYDAAMTLLIRARKLWATIEVHVGKWWEMDGMLHGHI